MVLFTTYFTIFGISVDSFIIITAVIVLALIVAGIILMIRNVRPILGLLLLIFAVALIIGVSYDADGIRRELTKFWKKVNNEEITDEEKETEPENPAEPIFDSINSTNSDSILTE